MTRLAELSAAVRPFTHEDRAKSWRLLLTTLMIAAVFLIGSLWGPLVLRVLFSILLGLTLVRIFIFYHDYLHGAIFRDSPLAAWTLKAFGILILNPPSVWKRSHNYHHEHNSQIATASVGSFPVMTTDQYLGATAAERFRYRAARHPLTILFGYLTIFLAGMCARSFLKDPRRHWDSAVALLVHVILVVMLARLGTGVLLLSYMVPLMMACAVGAYLFYIQHNFPTVLLRPRTEWDFVGAALDSSSFMAGSRLVHWFTGNIGYHHVHHLNSTIPFYRLPEAMAAIPILQKPRQTSLAPGEILRCFRLKLWDPESQTMVGWRETS